MPEIRVVAVIAAKEDEAGEVSAALVSLAKESRQEEGCLSYELFTSAAEPSTFVTMESWRDQAAIDFHFTTPHIAAAMQAADGRLSAPLAVHTLVPVPVAG